MEVRDAVINRRSIRGYDANKTVSREVIAEILDAARYAPSSGNLQNWKVILVFDPNQKAELASSALRQQWITSAPVLLVICNTVSDVERLYKERGKSLYSIQNVAAFIQNILLLAQDKGLSTCWVGAFDSEGVRRVLRIPDGVEPEAIISVGYGIEEVDVPPKKDVAKFTFFESWGNDETSFGSFPIDKHKTAVKDKGKSVFDKLKAMVYKK